MGAQCIYDRGLPPTQTIPAKSHTLSKTSKDANRQLSPNTSLCSPSLLVNGSSGSTYIDPFHTYPSSLDPECINRVLSFGKSSFAVYIGTSVS
jgi:hypothetical protein